MAMAMGLSPWTAGTTAVAQKAEPPAASDPAANLDERIQDIDKAIGRQVEAGRISQAIPVAREKLDLIVRVRGKDHPQAGDARRELETYERLAARPRAVQDRFAEARRGSARGGQLHGEGQFAQAAEVMKQVLAILREVLGEEHLETAACYNNLGETLWNQGNYAEAEAMHRRALAVRLKARGEDHIETATSYNNLAEALGSQAKYEEAEAMHRRVLAILRKVLGEEHVDTATSCDNLAGILRDRGKLAEAEAFYRRALSIRLKVLGDGNPATASSYNNMALTLRDEGKSAEAEAMQRSALAILMKFLGEEHPHTATSYNNLAMSLEAQRKYPEAEAMQRRALAIRRKALGEGHPHTANSYQNLAGSLLAQGKTAEAEATYRRALAINLEALGAEHPQVVPGYFRLAGTLLAQGKHVEAEAMSRRAVAVCLKAVGNGHPRTALCYGRLAAALDLQGKHGEALDSWRLAAASYEQSRLSGLKGLDAAIGGASPLPDLAAAEARAGRPLPAWTSWERGLARGVVDEVARRAARPLDAGERGREAELLGRSQAVDERINRILAARALSAGQEKTLEELRGQANEVRGQLLDLERQFEEKYGALASRAATIDEVRKALPEDTALVGWIDTKTAHWACLLGHSGEPIWVRLAGSGKEGAWTKEEEGLAQGLRSELNPETTRGKAGPVAESLARQRLEPLEGHLAGVKRLIVVNSPGMAGVPVEVVLAARPDPAWAGITVSYTPSASMFAYLAGRPIPRERPATLLAVADPAYLEPKDDAPTPEPPGSGLAVAGVTPNGNADLNGIREGDILLSYAGTELKRAGDLRPVASAAGPKKVAVKYWRAGIARDVEVAAGPLGVDIDSRPAAEFVRAHRESDRILLGMRGGLRARLPGTRREVEALSGLFPVGAATTILGSEACEATVQGLARSGKLRGYRYLHFATHGESDPRFAYRTALILAPDPAGSADPSAMETDGTITAEQIARTWELDADLVVLSACESGLGVAAGSEGYLGFAQPLFARGARSLVLSQWKVDDDATALLMARFYRNLLGKREGLTAPMPKAEALDEAKRWLRRAGSSEVGAALAALPRGTIVRREAVKVEPSAHPYENPIYWAGFVLVGAPD
jgi:tetratricopeptide (TPR) repeat protein